MACGPGGNGRFDLQDQIWGASKVAVRSCVCRDAGIVLVTLSLEAREAELGWQEAAGRSLMTKKKFNLLRQRKINYEYIFKKLQQF